MHIINSLIVQLETIQSLLMKDLDNDNVTYNYFIKEIDYKFLDLHKLNNYLLETKIENLHPLERVNNLCVKIRILWNDKLGNPIKVKKLKEWIRTDTKNGGFVSTEMDFNVLHLEDSKCNIIKVFEVTSQVLKGLYDEEYIRTDVHKIVLLCKSISHNLTGAHPSLINKEDPEQWYIQYKSFKSFRIIGKPYKINDYSEMKNIFEDRIFTSRYIFLKLDKEARQEFKNHVIKNLIEIKEMQILPEFENLLSELILVSKKDFKPLEKVLNKIDENIPQQFQHTNIFKNNAFEVWQSMFDSFEVADSSRTDVRFMFEIMKKDKLIHNTVTLTNITNWVNNEYEISLGKLPFTDINSNSNKNRRIIYNQAKTNFTD